ncbi:protein kinase domain-containing protein [Blautia sp.]
MQISEGKRIPLTGKRVKMKFLDAEGQSYTYEVSIDDYLGEGTSCICYEVTVFKDQESLGQKRVLKQFYPDPLVYEIQTNIEGMKLTINGYPDGGSADRNKELSDLSERFQKAFTDQMLLANQKECAEAIVQPDLKYFDQDGITKYVLYEADYGTSLKLKEIKDLKEFIEKMYGLACALEKIHGKNIVYMDLKPENVLVSGSGKIKLFDFDAALDLEHIKEIKLQDIRYAVNRLGLIAPEIRPDRLTEFKQNKKLILHKRVDIYSFGAIMLNYFLGRYPTDADCMTDMFKEELMQCFNRKFRNQLTEEEQRMLCSIIEKSTRQEIAKRYNETSDLVRDLDELRKMLELPVSKRQAKFKSANMRVRSAYIMDKYPLCEYRRKCGEEEWTIDALLIGNSAINEAFFANIIACAQMLNTKLVVRLLLSQAQESVRGYLRKWPLLRKTTELFWEERPLRKDMKGNEIQLDEEITDFPFAELHFYEWDKEKQVKEILSSMQNAEKLSWVIVGDADIQKNKDIAEEVAEYFSTKEGTFFIGYLDDRGDGYDLREPETSYANVKMVPFSCNDKNTLDEKLFEKGIADKAKFLHKYYLREWNEHADKEYVKQDFRADNYNVNSSICSVLSIPYKLVSIGIYETGMQAAAEYKELVLGEEKQERSPGQQKRFNQMIYLEHHRWMAFMMTEGYDRPDKKRLESYAFRGKNDQRNKTDNPPLHPCICRCEQKNGVILDQLSHEMWEVRNLEKIEEKLGQPLDELDRMSIRFHQWCGRRIRTLDKNGVFSDAFYSLEKAIKEEKYPAKSYDTLNMLKTLFLKMLHNDSNINSLWEEGCRNFAAEIKERTRTAEIHLTAVSDAFANLKNLMRIVIERNNYHDYKRSDQSVMEIIPLLLIFDAQIRRIHKPVAPKNWQNAVSSLIIEPEELILYTDEPENLDVELIKTFLSKERGIHHRNKSISVTVKDINELENLKITDQTIPGVLDITGLSAEETYELSQRKNLEKLPVIYFKDGKIHSLTKGSGAEYYGALRRHLSVREVFHLYNADIHSEKSLNYMLGLSDVYQQLWNAYIATNGFDYKVLVTVLRHIEQQQYWKLEKEDSQNIYKFEKNRIPYAMLQSTGLLELVEKLQKEKWIEGNYTLPGNGLSGKVVIRTKAKKLVDLFEKMFGLIEKAPYEHRFVYLKTHIEPFTERPSEEELHYIYDDTLMVNEEFEDNIIKNLVDGEIKRFDRKHNKKVTGAEIQKILEDTLGRLANQKNQAGESILIESIGVKSMTEKSEAGVRIAFAYRNRAIKECLMKEGNVLETYVYHSIWKDVLPDDVKLNVAFTWDSRSEADSLEEGAIRNEIDLVCTYNMQTFFISCKQSMPQTSFLQEIQYFADYFGIDGKAILITSNWRTAEKENRTDAKLVSSRSNKMKVYYIDRDMLGESIPDMASGRLAKYIRNIFEGKKDWRNIN